MAGLVRKLSGDLRIKLKLMDLAIAADRTLRVQQDYPFQTTARKKMMTNEA